MNLLKIADMQQIDVITRSINWDGLGIPCEKMIERDLQWPDNLCNGILWMVLGEKREDLVKPGDELWKGCGRI